MSLDDPLEEIRERIRKSLPKTADITSVEFEGPEIAVYSSSPKFIGNEREEIKNLVKKMRKRGKEHRKNKNISRSLGKR